MSSAAEDFLEMYRCPTPNELGEIGEYVTAHTLQDDLGLKVVRNIYLPVDSKFTEIDMIAISSHGLFVIENKNYKGLIIGMLYTTAIELSLYLTLSDRMKNI